MNWKKVVSPKRVGSNPDHLGKSLDLSLYIHICNKLCRDVTTHSPKCLAA